jgi:hypothetical protein
MRQNLFLRPVAPRMKASRDPARDLSRQDVSSGDDDYDGARLLAHPVDGA